MKLGIIKRILKDDLAKGGEVPAWMDYLLQPLNDFIEKVGLALQGRLTFSDNFLCKTVTQSFNTGQSYTLNPKLTSQQATLKVLGVLLMDTGGATVTGWKWVRNSNGTISVVITFSDVSSATCSVYIYLG
jgi:hypothetical protein